MLRDIISSRHYFFHNVTPVCFSQDAGLLCGSRSQLYCGRQATSCQHLAALSIHTFPPPLRAPHQASFLCDLKRTQAKLERDSLLPDGPAFFSALFPRLKSNTTINGVKCHSARAGGPYELYKRNVRHKGRKEKGNLPVRRWTHRRTVWLKPISLSESYFEKKIR